MSRTLLHIDASARLQESTSRALSAQIVERLNAETVVRRDLSEALPQISETWINANFTPADQRTDAQRETLALSDSLVEELKAADTIVIGLPVYNFSVPASLKAWIDLTARAGLTFEYSENGPRGLLQDKRVVIAFASGGTALGSDIDFASGYITQIMGFYGITDVEIIAADRMAIDPQATLALAQEAIQKLAA